MKIFTFEAVQRDKAGYPIVNEYNETGDRLERKAVGFGALSHETRLTVFRKIMKAGADGVTAGELADHAGVTPSNLSAHLTVLTHSGLIKVRRDGRRRIYTAIVDTVADLVAFLVEDCCDGHPAVWAQLPSSQRQRQAG